MRLLHDCFWFRLADWSEFGIEFYLWLSWCWCGGCGIFFASPKITGINLSTAEYDLVAMWDKE